MAADSTDETGQAGQAGGSDETLSYEEARDELIQTVQRLEAGGTTLEESLALWQRGEELAQICQRWLEGARARLDAAVNETAEEHEPGVSARDL